MKPDELTHWPTSNRAHCWLVGETRAGTKSTRRGSSVLRIRREHRKTPESRAFRIFDALLFVLKKSSYNTKYSDISSYFPSILHVNVRRCSFHARQDYVLTRDVQPSFNTLVGHGSRYALCFTIASLTSIYWAFSATPLNTVEASKRLAAYTAVDRHVLPEDKVGHNN